MDMDALEELSGSNDQTMIVKGKRTKRQRPMSPTGMAVTSCSSNGCSQGGGRDGEGQDDLYNTLIPSSTTTSEISTSSEEDEDMANCLILLAQGGGCVKQEDQAEVKMEKFRSRRFNEMVTSTAGKVGFYVYECKTCNRTFPSFQALGGHRASHKKPKVVVEEKKAASVTTSDDHEEEEEDGRQFMNKPSDQPQSVEISTKTIHGNNKPKIHECSICGSEFSSGQALGGHMRRHRNPATTKVAIDTISPIEKSQKPRNIFPLDLNLPAPEDDHRDLKFQFAANQQHLVFSSPALIDCHY